ncbi:DUF934 domain-containing protein [Marinobacter daepoensis]|uniref:DUF934 domain-containing protein n=1 Tax=Marinobacter daepoensis TaxID=262077 RepID=UPI001C95EB69|nr:DUF934 domain-containing protein [Marinobacter daepoensis]MBY6032416.1 DUF934 domain-containing protein [Marinobacter daepoensis]
MPDVIAADGTIRNDDWVVVPRPVTGESIDIPANTPALIPVDLWLAGYEHFAGNAKIGVWFDSHDEPELLAGKVAELPLIAVNFPRFVDGRGYSIGRLLRERFEYHGELRAIGDVLLDQLQFMKRCGFDSYALRSDKDTAKAAKCLNFFSQTYQAATDTNQPLFRRRAS